MAQPPKILYNSSEIASCIKQLMANPLDGQRRVVLVAYVGRDYASFLPDPKDIEIVCSPTPGATRAEAVAELQKAGAKLQFSDNLHMKVYWAQNRGCIITSANLSQNALGISGLHEAGVLVGADDVNIDTFLKAANPYDVNDKNLRRLAELQRDFDRRNPGLWKTKKDYNEWHSEPVPVRAPWKLGWWVTRNVDFSKSSKQLVETLYNKHEVCDTVDVAKGQAKDGDWLLCFKVSEKKIRKVSEFKWLYVDHVVEVAKSDKGYNKDYPYEAVQVFPANHYPSPPFTLDDDFKRAFTKAISNHEIETQATLNPAKQLLGEIASELKNLRSV
jgi:hypothetical protein